MAQLPADALIIGPSSFFGARSEQLGALALRHAVPAIFQYGPFATAGGLLSYGTDETEYYHLVGLYTGRILKGEKPGDLPVQQSIKIELIINLKTAKAPAEKSWCSPGTGFWPHYGAYRAELV